METIIDDIDNGWFCPTCKNLMRNKPNKIICENCGWCFVKPSDALPSSNKSEGGEIKPSEVLPPSDKSEVEELKRRVAELEHKVSERDAEFKKLASSVCTLAVLLENFVKPKSDKRRGETVFCQKCRANTHHYIPGMICYQCSKKYIL